MTEYKVMAKPKHGKRFQCFGHHTESKRASIDADRLTKQAWTAEVKVIVIDGSLKEELRYK